MYLISIDGACRRNGQPDCTAAGGVFIQWAEPGEKHLAAVDTFGVHEYNSTNQRGELLALLEALLFLKKADSEAQILTDSEYIFNAMTKEWPSRWDANGWLTASGEPVKNEDLWKKVLTASRSVPNEVSYFHIKGHVIPFGAVTARNALADESGGYLACLVKEKYDKIAHTKQAALEHASALSERNNGFRLTPDILKRFVVANVVADAVATKAVEDADRKI